MLDVVAGVLLATRLNRLKVRMVVVLWCWTNLAFEWHVFGTRGESFLYRAYTRYPAAVFGWHVLPPA